MSTSSIPILIFAVLGYDPDGQIHLLSAHTTMEGATRQMIRAREGHPRVAIATTVLVDDTPRHGIDPWEEFVVPDHDEGEGLA